MEKIYMLRKNEEYMSYYRHPQTTQEMRQVEDAEEQGVKIRSKRNKAHLPNSYDDIRNKSASKNYKSKPKGKTKSDRAKQKRKHDQIIEDLSSGLDD